MATTSPDNIWSPDSGDDYALTVDLAAMADTVQDALTSSRESTPYRPMTDAERLALTGGDLFAGLKVYTTDTEREWLYTGTEWRSNNRTAVFNISITGFSDSTLAGSSIPTTANSSETTDSSFITARTGTECTVKSGLYLVSIYFEVASQAFSGRTFAEVAVGSTVVTRNNSQNGVGENGVGATAICQAVTDGTVITARIFKNTGGNSSVSGRLMIAKLA